MYPAAFFAPRFFPPRYFPERGGSGATGYYFPRRYFAQRYFPTRYFPSGGGGAPVTVPICVEVWDKQVYAVSTMEAAC